MEKTEAQARAFAPRDANKNWRHLAERVIRQRLPDADVLSVGNRIVRTGPFVRLRGTLRSDALPEAMWFSLIVEEADSGYNIRALVIKLVDGGNA